MLANAPPGPRAAEAEARLGAMQRQYDALRMTTPVTVPPALMPGLGSGAQKEEAPLRPDEVYVRARDRVVLLWDELGIDDGVRGHFFATAFREVSAESIAMIHAEIERLVALRAREAEVKSTVEVREGLLYVLQDVVEKTSRSAAASANNYSGDSLSENGAAGFAPLDANVARQVRQLITKLRKASFDVVNAIIAWRSALGYDAVYLWRGTSYLLKMATDGAFLVAAPAVAHAISIPILNNPLFDPARPAGQGPSESTEHALTRMASAIIPPKRTVSNVGPTGYTHDQFTTAREVLADERRIWERAQREARVFTFDAPNDGVADIDIVQSTYDECFFRCPDEFNASTRRRAAKDVQERMVVIARVIRIQRAVRRMLAVKHAAVLERRRVAATRIQAQARRLIAKKAAAQRRNQFAAAVRIQALIRGRHVRHTGRSQMEESCAALKIQRSFRSFTAKKRVDMIRYLHRAATTIQAAWRGVQGRQAAERRALEVRGKAAGQVQRVWRGVTLRRSGRADPKRVAAVALIQRWYRGMKARQQASMLRGLHVAARIIQLAVRRRILRRSSNASAAKR
jgi:hypothetical protein